MAAFSLVGQGGDCTAELVVVDPEVHLAQHLVHPSLLLQVLVQFGGRQIHAHLLQLESYGAGIVQLDAFFFLLQLGLHGRELHLTLRPNP